MQISKTKRHFFCFFALLVAGFLTQPSEILAAETEKIQYPGIKTALIYNFLKLTQWPQEDAQDTKDNLHICLLGADPFDGVLGLLSGHTAQQRIISVEERKNPFFVNGCNLVFIEKNQEKNLEVIFKSLEAKPILTVSDIQGFSRKGGMIEIARNDRAQIYLDINVKAIESTDLEVKEDLLRMAGMVWIK